jgi:ATP-dependent Clp protease protease subunit
MPKREPVRIFEGTARPYEPFWRVVDAAQSESGEPEIEFYGIISEFSWRGDEVTPAKFKEDLEKLGQGGPVTVRINSAGGEVWAASVIRSIIVDYPGRVTTRIDGLCASAATYVAMAGDVVKMQDSAFFMIHDPWMMTWGTVEELRKAINLLKTIKKGIVETYQSKTELEPEEISRMMNAETWMTAQEALEKGFIDEVISVNAAKPYKAAQNTAVVNTLRNYANLPEALRSLLQPEESPVDPEPNPEADRLRAEANKTLATRGTL